MCAWDASLKPRLSIPNFSHSSGEKCKKIIGKAWVEASGMYIDHSFEQLFIMQDMYAVWWLVLCVYPYGAGWSISIVVSLSHVSI